MDEFQIKVLEANGYSYIDGGIVDAEGKYVSAVDLNGETYNSESDYDLWNRGQEVEKKYSTPIDPVDNLKAFEKAPLTTILTEEDKNYYPLYSEQQEANDEPTYDNVELFQKDMEDKALEKEEDNVVGLLRNLQSNGYDSILTDDHINEVKENAAYIKKVQEENPSWDVKLEKTDDTDARLAENSWYNPENISIYTEKAWVGIAKFLMPDTFGMEGSDEEKKEYEAALEKRKELQKPAAKIMESILQVQQEKLEKVWEDKSILEQFHLDNDMVRYALNEVEAEKTKLRAFIDGDNVYNPFNDKFMIQAGTMGIQGAWDAYLYNKPLSEKIEKGEELTENEQLVAEALATIHSAKGVKAEQNTLYNITEGTFDSATFLIGGAPGRLAMRGTTKAVTRGVSKALTTRGLSSGAANLTGRVIGEGVNMFGQAVLHPDSHVKALNKYYGDIQFDVNEEGNMELTTDRRTYKTLMDEIEINENSLRDSISKESDPEKLAAYNEQLKKVQEYKKGIKKPETALNSAMYGFTEVLKENAIENYGGRLANKVVNNRYTRKLAAKPWVQSIENGTIGQSLKKANNLFGGVKEKFNALTGNKGSKLVGNNLEEMAEEVMTQLVPVWGETEDEAIQRKGELLEGSFYGQVAGQTLLMGALMKGVYSPLAGYNAYQNAKNLKDKRKAFKTMMNEFKNEGLSDAKVEELLMSAGAGNYTVQEYNNKIAQLREKGENEKANELERNKTYNMGKNLVAIGKGKQFVRNMNSVIASGNVSPESIASIQEAVQEVKILEADMAEHGNLKNKDYVLELKSKLRYTQKQKSSLEKRQSELQGQEQSPARDGEIAGIEAALKDIKVNEGQINKALKHETSPKMVKRLEQEAEVTAAIATEYKKLVKANKGVPTPKLRQDAIDTIKDKYAQTVSNGVYQNSIKQVDRFILGEVFTEAYKTKKNEVLPEEQEEVVVPTPEKMEAQTHAQEIGNNINQVTELAEEQEENFSNPDNRAPVDNLDYAGPEFDRC